MWSLTLKEKCAKELYTEIVQVFWKQDLHGGTPELKTSSVGGPAPTDVNAHMVKLYMVVAVRPVTVYWVCPASNLIGWAVLSVMLYSSHWIS